MSEKNLFTENRIKKYKCLFRLFFALSALTMIFIFYNATQIPEDSNARSHAVAELLRRLVFFAKGLDDKTFHVIVRKAAHFTEYGMLGFFVGGTELCAQKIKKRRFVSICFLIALLTAVFDEYLQGFFGRTSAVSDVLIDFSGAICGFLLLRGISVLIRKIKLRNNN